MVEKVLTFEQVVRQLETQRNKHVLLGNGFSIACRPDIFAYEALFDRARFPEDDALARAAFDVLETRDFEIVMRALRDGARLIRHADRKATSLADGFMRAVTQLNDILVNTIAGQHPEYPRDIPESAYGACRSFLKHFKNIYTVNYDLLLYWALMHKDSGPNIESDDGFRAALEDPDAEYVTWEVEKTDTQNVHYMHGALHLFDAGAELKKYTWSRTGVRLIEQVRSALEQGYYPLIVAEGTSRQKKAKIMHSNYLSRSYRSLPKVTGAMVIFGHSLADNDEHIIRLLEMGKIKEFFVSLHGDPDTRANRRIIERANELASVRRDRTVQFFDAVSATVWG